VSTGRAPLPPGPDLGFWRQLQRMRRDFLGYLVECAREHGDVVRLTLAPGVATTLVNHPDLVRDVLVDRAALFRKSAQTRRMVGKFLGEGLVLSEGEDHARQRKLIRPAFHPERLTAYARVMADETHRHVRRWKAGEIVDVDADMGRLSLRIVARTLFGADLEGAGAGVGEAMTAFEQAVKARFLSIPLPDWIPTPANRREARSVASLHRILAAMIAERRAEPARERTDLLQMLLDARDEDGAPMPERRLLDEAVTLFFAGHETSTHQIAWTLLLLAEHPEVEASLRAEVREAAGRAAPTFERASDLPLLDRTLKEALRLYPPTWVFDRAPVEDVTLGGFRVPAGEAIYVSPFVTQRDPRFFPDPDRFDPGRWAGGQDPPRFSYLPFGAGPRMCVGQAYAQLEARVVLATLLGSGARLARSSSDPVALEPSATLKPRGGLPLRVVEAAS
jgi:cytochrome P450